MSLCHRFRNLVLSDWLQISPLFPVVSQEKKKKITKTIAQLHKVNRETKVDNRKKNKIQKKKLQKQLPSFTMLIVK